MPSLDTAIVRTPVPFDPKRADDICAALAPALQQGDVGALLRGTAGSSPYLGRLIERHRDWLEEIATAEPAQSFDALMTEMATQIDAADGQQAVRIALRIAKARAALLIALCDLGGIWTLEEVTHALTYLADQSVETCARWLLRLELRSERLPGLSEADLENGAGYVVLAMGKMGARELNYSSDIDLIALFDDERFDSDTVLDARARYIHVTKHLARMLSENTDGGYAFRTDLRLRPAPSTTPVCMAMGAAERYYESVGRTWERAAHIKARPLMDKRAGADYLKTLTPFVWRRHLDFAAIEDIHDMLRKIRAQKARFTPGSLPGHDLKLGPGGIREIEFFAQTRQLIVGGREPSLRDRTTKGALSALADGGWISSEVRDRLSADYTELRTIEHRLQMMEDSQTHAIPKSDEARSRLACLCGFSEREAFERGVTDCLKRVHATCEEFFTPGAPVSKTSHPPPTEDFLAEKGFDRAADALRQIMRWHDGGIAATRSERARALFQAIEPQIISRLSGAASPDQALIYLDRFLSGLPAGVQVFSLFHANPQLLDLIVEICASAPRLAKYLGRHSHTLDTLLDRDFWDPLPDARAMEANLTAHLSSETDYERVLDASRRWAREQWFRAGVQVLRGLSDEREAGAAFSRIAEACLKVLSQHVIDNFSARHGPPPGTGMAVLAMGKLGSGEMTSGSDLDLITIYDAAGVESSDGKKPLVSSAYYPRLTQALVAALTAQTSEGALYEVDMRLRPSGRKGPVSVSLAAFDQYQRNDAWVWEHLALTRARVITGPPSLAKAIETIIDQALAGRAGQQNVLTEAVEMRQRLLAANAAERTNPWSLKHAAGGLMEIEFLLQTGMLYHGLSAEKRPADAIPALVACQWLDADEGAALAAAIGPLQRLQQAERVALDSPLNPETVGEELRAVMTRLMEEDKFETLQDRLVRLEKAAASVCERLLAITETADQETS